MNNLKSTVYYMCLNILLSLDILITHKLTRQFIICTGMQIVCRLTPVVKLVRPHIYIQTYIHIYINTSENIFTHCVSLHAHLENNLSFIKQFYSTFPGTQQNNK